MFMFRVGLGLFGIGFVRFCGGCIFVVLGRWRRVLWVLGSGCLVFWCGGFIMGSGVGSRL